MTDASPVTDFEVFLTASEAYPAFETLCLKAERSIRAGFRVFDLTTRLRGAQAREIGETWFDLLVHLLDRGVRIDITVTDFDPILATDDHRRSWLAARQLAAAGELSDGGNLSFRIAMHPARVGALPLLALEGRIKAELKDRDADPLTPGLREAKETGENEVPSLVPATHHHKCAVIDGEWLYLGGLDLNERRYDTLDHDRPAPDTWMDIQAIARGPVVAAAEAHLKSFVAVTHGEDEPEPAVPGFLRTLSAKRAVALARISPRPVVTEIEAAHLEAIERARGLIYLETQFFRHPPLAEALAAAAARRPDLACLLIIPAAPDKVAFENNDREDAQLAAQQEVISIRTLTDGFGPRVAIASPAQPRAMRPDDMAGLHGGPMIYVHSKLSIFDTREAILSSANLNGRSLRWDTEAGLHLTDPSHVGMLWDRVRSHWLDGYDVDPDGHGPDTITRISDALAENARLAPEARRHFLLPYDASRAQSLASPVYGVPGEMV